MKTSVKVLITSLAAQACAVPTLYLAGDSTMALGGGGSSTQGFGEYLKYSFSDIKVVNDAVAGRSARSYWNEGKFAALADKVVAGDYVLFEFGHNDGGSLSTTDNGRTDCFGGGSETCISPTTGETIYTYVYYLLQAGKLVTAKGAHLVIASPPQTTSGNQALGPTPPPASPDMLDPSPPASAPSLPSSTTVPMLPTSTSRSVLPSWILTIPSTIPILALRAPTPWLRLS
ncbi:hypothetical protein DID88_001624 [Monilinia fructigena]|uniref:SGNH hydrolase-type esterase domain-containing protein n=1 Tax=Monilinia fructigena TaxID=38457 RepID=A0A395J1R5_9HELO|nr:hypothetical protein DID88_001624 [Monilinia fructigena]